MTYRCISRLRRAVVELHIDANGPSPGLSGLAGYLYGPRFNEAQSKEAQSKEQVIANRKKFYLFPWISNESAFPQ
jgi:hypothetical protein